MKRRNFLLGLLAAPLAPLLARLLPEPRPFKQVARVCDIDVKAM